MLWQPRTQIGLAGFHVRDADLVALEQVRHDGQVAAVGEIVGEQLGIGEDAEDVGEEEDGFFGGFVVLWVGEVGVDFGERVSFGIWIWGFWVLAIAYSRQCS